MMWTPAEQRDCMREAMRTHGVVGWLTQWNRLHPWRRAARGFTWAEYRAAKKRGAR